jgi:hypothetical protein
MSQTKSVRVITAVWICVLLLLSSAVAAPKHCAPVGGAFLTNIGGFGDHTTMGRGSFRESKSSGQISQGAPLFPFPPFPFWTVLPSPDQ